MEYISDDEDHFMDVDAQYLSSDEAMLTEDEDDLVRILTPKTARATRLQNNGSKFKSLATTFAENCLKDISELEKAEFNKKEFPPQYQFLLDIPVINDIELRKYPNFFDLVFTKQTTPEMIIEKEIAIVCLFWAQAINDCSCPLLKEVVMNHEEIKAFRGRANPTKQYSRVSFGIQFTLGNCTESRNRNVKKGMVVFIKTEDDQRIMARVTRAEGSYCQLSIRTPTEEDLEILKLDNLTVSIYEVPPEFIPTSMLNSIEGMKSGFLHQIVVPKPRFYELHSSYLLRKDRAMKSFMKTYNVSTQLTESQRDAVFAICNREHDDCPFVLFGPPGTGKTFTISQAIQTILKMDPDNRVLICTPSNMAADRVATQLMDDFGQVLNVHNVLRLRSTGNNYYMRDRKFDPITCFDTDTEMFTIPVNFDSWRVVVCTLGCSSHIALNTKRSGFFSHIMIDEAGQASEAEMWIPIGSLATPHTSIVLCGDPKQLGPVITLDISKHLQRQFTSPLFRYMELPDYQTDKRLCCQLVDCFRCPKVLTSVISKLFYDGVLMNVKRKPDRFDYSGLEMSAECPMKFVAIDGVEERMPKGFSFCNRVEAMACVDYIKFLVENKGVLPGHIGVISPYNHQSKLIVEELRKHKTLCGPEIIVNSVERFQGSERDVIIMTTTRTKALGFMADDLRVNTSLTRAKKMLIVIGNEAALSRHESWLEFIAYCKQIDAYKIWDPILDPSFVDYDVQIIESFSKVGITP